MTCKELYEQIVTKFMQLPGVEDVLSENIRVHAKTLSPEEAIGITERKDYPILTGRDVMIEAEYKGFLGQAFTEAPLDFSGTLKDVLALPFDTDAHARGLLIAAINAVMGSMGCCDRMVHCKNQGPKLCGVKVAEELKTRYGDPRILMVGFQPSIIANITECFSEVHVLDLNPDNVGSEKFGRIIGNGGDTNVRESEIAWADLILCTGSTVCNGTLIDYLNTGKETLFYGTTLAGVASLLELPRLCFADM